MLRSSVPESTIGRSNKLTSVPLSPCTPISLYYDWPQAHSNAMIVICLYLIAQGWSWNVQWISSNLETQYVLGTSRGCSLQPILPGSEWWHKWYAFITGWLHLLLYWNVLTWECCIPGPKSVYAKFQNVVLDSACALQCLCTKDGSACKN